MKKLFALLLALVMVFCLVTFAVTALIKIDPSFGKASDNKDEKDE